MTITGLSSFTAAAQRLDGPRTPGDSTLLLACGPNTLMHQVRLVVEPALLLRRTAYTALGVLTAARNWAALLIFFTSRCLHLMTRAVSTFESLSAALISHETPVSKTNLDPLHSLMRHFRPGLLSSALSTIQCCTRAVQRFSINATWAGVAVWRNF